MSQDKEYQKQNGVKRPSGESKPRQGGYDKSRKPKGKPYRSHEGNPMDAKKEMRGQRKEVRSYDKATRAPKHEDKRTTVSLRIEKLDDDYCGVAYKGANRYVVRGALPGEEVLALEKEVVGNIHLCRVKKVLQPSPHRVPNDCHVAGCGGCTLRHMDYTYQLEAKTAYVRRKLHPFTAEVAPCIAAEGLRNKVHLVFGMGSDKNGKEGITVGFFDAETSAVVDAPVCLAHARWYPAVVNTLRAWASRHGNMAYDPVAGVGDLRFAVVRRLSSGMSVTIVSRTRPEGLSDLYTALTKLAPHVSLWLNLNDHRTNEVFAGEFVFVAGQEKLQGEMLGLTFGLAPDSFFQTNTAMARTAYRLATEMVGENKPVLDLFSGIGLTSVLFARNGCDVDSVELSPSAVADATELASRVGLKDKVHVHLGDVAQVLPTLPPREGEVVFVDPPRAGLGESVCRAILQREPATIVYMSCNVQTLAADLALLCPAYTVDKVYPLDMFPMTKHVECVTMMTKK